MAHKLARILWHQVQNQTAYDESFLVLLGEKRQRRVEIQLAKKAAALGYDLIPRKEAA